MWSLLQLSPREQRRLEAGEITEGHARALLASPPDQRERMLDEILQGGTSVREAEQMARSGRRTEAAVSEPTAKAGAADANLAAVEARLRERFGTRVLIQRRGAKGAISIEFYSEEDLERLSFILNLTRDLGVNLAGVEIIVNLRRRIETMQQEMDRFVAQVRDELGKRVQEGAIESSRALVRVSGPGRSFKVEKR